MRIFTKYARFYDGLYRDKNYVAECNYLCRLFDRHSDIKVRNILDLGCGTGSHAIILTQRGYNLTALDRSISMLNIARVKAKEFGVVVDFYKEDIRKFNLKRRFDAIISMFAVMGYQTKTEDFLNTLRYVRKHLRPGGVFIFDVWFGPAVLSQKPRNRIRIIKDGKSKIIRYTNAKLDLRQNIVEVKFNVKKITGKAFRGEAKEVHLMRFFFIPEIEYLTKLAGFKINIFYAFLTEKQNISEEDWNLCVLLK